jgi:AcrR family transcriptional regulator
MSPRSPEDNQAVHQDRRARLLDAALAVFMERGYEGTRIQEIARRAGLSYGLVYHYFQTKESIFMALVEMALGAALALTNALPEGSKPSALGDFAAHATADPSAPYFAIIIEALSKQSVSPDLSERTRKAVLSIKARFASICGEAAAEAILAMLLGASLMKVCKVSDGAFLPASVLAVAASAKG